MKTPKRPDAPIIDEAEYDCYGIPTGDITTYWDVYHEAHARWKRKNRIKQLKHTIAVLKHRLQDTEETLKWTQRYTKCFLVSPSHWLPIDENGNQLTRKQWKKRGNKI